ncbi:hypothetical protein TYRP_003600 [Tyrophagus putrescentiae]|nr:hypothetical protein TYRP_003600 [Tyrophagus putrescentiae]
MRPTMKSSILQTKPNTVFTGDVLAQKEKHYSGEEEQKLSNVLPVHRGVFRSCVGGQPDHLSTPDCIKIVDPVVDRVSPSGVHPSHQRALPRHNRRQSWPREGNLAVETSREEGDHWQYQPKNNEQKDAKAGVGDERGALEPLPKEVHPHEEVALRGHQVVEEVGDYSRGGALVVPQNEGRQTGVGGSVGSGSFAERQRVQALKRFSQSSSINFQLQHRSQLSVHLPVPVSVDVTDDVEAEHHQRQLRPNVVQVDHIGELHTEEEGLLEGGALSSLPHPQTGKLEVETEGHQIVEVRPDDPVRAVVHQGEESSVKEGQAAGHQVVDEVGGVEAPFVVDETVLQVHADVGSKAEVHAQTDGQVAAKVEKVRQEDQTTDESVQVGGVAAVDSHHLSTEIREREFKEDFKNFGLIFFDSMVIPLMLLINRPQSWPRTAQLAVEAGREEGDHQQYQPKDDDQKDVEARVGEDGGVLEPLPKEVHPHKEVALRGHQVVEKIGDHPRGGALVVLQNEGRQTGVGRSPAPVSVDVTDDVEAEHDERQLHPNVVKVDHIGELHTEEEGLLEGGARPPLPHPPPGKLEDSDTEAGQRRPTDFEPADRADVTRRLGPGGSRRGRKVDREREPYSTPLVEEAVLQVHAEVGSKAEVHAQAESQVPSDVKKVRQEDQPSEESVQVVSVTAVDGHHLSAEVAEEESKEEFKVVKESLVTYLSHVLPVHGGVSLASGEGQRLLCPPNQFIHALSRQNRSQNGSRPGNLGVDSGNEKGEQENVELKDEQQDKVHLVKGEEGGCSLSGGPVEV